MSQVVSALDFEEIKGNLKAFLKAKPQFKDYNFEGSNWSVLLDVLAYNAHYNAFYTNMVFNEMFIDSAIKQDSIVSHAKELNYVPRSAISARALIQVDLESLSDNTSNIESVVIPKGTTFSSRVGTESLTFVTDETVVVNRQFVDNGSRFRAQLEVHEGQYVSESFTFDEAFKQFTISNTNIDLASLTVYILTPGSVEPIVAVRRKSLIDGAVDEPGYFVEAAYGGRYAVVFGDGTSSYVPVVGSTIFAEYRVTAGSEGNFAQTFTIDAPVGVFNNVTVTTLLSSTGGTEPETLDSIKFNAPRHFQTQNRAITPDDYESLIKIQFPGVQHVAAYGGENVSPPQYGRVFVAIDLVGDDYMTDSRKLEITEFLRTKTPIGIEPMIVEPEYTYLQINAKINYNRSGTTATQRDVESTILDAILNFVNVNGSGFNSSLRISKLISLIDSNPVVNFSSVDVRMAKVYTPPEKEGVGINVDFQNPISRNSTAYDRSLLSSLFTYRGQSCRLENIDNDVWIVATVNEVATNIRKVGTIDYDNGTVSINSFIVSAYFGPGIKLIARPANSIVTTKNNVLLDIISSDVTVNAS
jgi:hypothetical protein